MQVVGQSLNQRASVPIRRSSTALSIASRRQNVTSPSSVGGVREAKKLHGVDWVKIYTDADFVGDGTRSSNRRQLVNSPSLTRRK